MGNSLCPGVPELVVEIFGNGGADRNRTCDLLIANETLYQLSYDPIHQWSDRHSFGIQACFVQLLSSAISNTDDRGLAAREGGNGEMPAPRFKELCQ